MKRINFEHFGHAELSKKYVTFFRNSASKPPKSFVFPKIDKILKNGDFCILVFSTIMYF